MVAALFPGVAAAYWEGWLVSWKATLAVALALYFAAFLAANSSRC